MNDTLTDNLPLLLWRARPDMSCEYVNRAWLDYTGYTSEQALGEGWTRCLHPEDLARWLDTCVRAFDEREPFDIEYRLRRRDGAYRWVLERATPRHSAEGVFVGYGGACIDIDAHKREPGGSAAGGMSFAPEFVFPQGEKRMNWDRIQGNWKQMKGKVKEKWGKLTDDEFDQMAGNRDQLVGKIQERYGIAKDEAERQVKDWESRA